MKILLIEDNELLLRLYKSAFTSMDVDSVCCSDVWKASKYKGSDFDFILLDYVLEAVSFYRKQKSKDNIIIHSCYQDHFLKSRFGEGINIITKGTFTPRELSLHLLSLHKKNKKIQLS